MDPADAAEIAPGYPVEFEADVVLSDGGTAHVRPIRPDDGERLVALHGRLSRESIYYRFFSPHPRLSEKEVVHFTTTDFVNRDDPAQRAVIETDRKTALAELDRVRAEIEKQQKEIVTIEDEARRAGVPSGWLRPGA